MGALLSIIFCNLLRFSLQIAKKGKSFSKEDIFEGDKKQPLKKRRLSTYSLPPKIDTIAEDEEHDKWSSMERMHEATCSKSETMTRSHDEGQRNLNNKHRIKSRSMEVNNYSNRSLSETSIGFGPSSPYEAPPNVKVQPFSSMSQRRDLQQAFVQPGYLRRAHSDLEFQIPLKNCFGSTQSLCANPGSSSQFDTGKEFTDVSYR